MDTTSVHEPTILPDTTYSQPRYYWECTCGAWTLERHRTKVLAALDYELDHRYPHARSQVPEHTMRPTEGAFGGPGWVCSCGTAGRPEGFQNERRARQAFNRHRTTALMLWIKAVHQHNLHRLSPEQRDDRERVLAWLAKPEDERARQAQYVLDQIL